jgi:5-(carboxyamino)imidazole ribonucleotide synthase
MLEQGVPFIAETSVIVARSADRQAASFPMFRNEHRKGILFQTVIPAGFSDATENQARRIAEGIARDIGLVGVIAVEMFVLADGRVLVNELAARPHNSGHVTLRACTRSQFELHIQAICGLPMPQVDLLRPGVMTNLLGDLWREGREPDWTRLYARPTGTLHLYGKSPRPGRKMGHMIHTGPTAEAALQEASQVFNDLSQLFS